MYATIGLEQQDHVGAPDASATGQVNAVNPLMRDELVDLRTPMERDSCMHFVQR
jgi:hypothetical protein